MRTYGRPHRASPKPKPGASDRYLECLRLLYAGTTLTPEQEAAFERVARAVPYRAKPQGELPLEPDPCA